MSEAVVQLALAERRNAMEGPLRFDALVTVHLPLASSSSGDDGVAIALQQDRGEVCCLWDAAVLLSRAMVDSRVFPDGYFAGKVSFSCRVRALDACH